MMAMESMVSNGSIWMDNLEIAEVNVSYSKPEDYIHFDFNNKSNPKYLELSSSCIEPNGTRHLRGVYIAPYHAKLLCSDISQEKAYKLFR